MMSKWLVSLGCLMLCLTAWGTAAEKIVVIETGKGVIKFKFFEKDAPNTVANFIKLAGSGFYNRLTFHRVVPGFVIHGGDPAGNGTGGPGYTIKAEFNSRPHLEGTVAMARSTDPDSAGSQFYICLGPQSFLDGQYTVFGQVTDGMEVVKKIALGDVMSKVYLTGENAPQKAKTKEVVNLTKNVHWLGHSAFRIEEGGKIIYLDPYKLKTGSPAADLILITHEHYDHCSPDDVKKIQKENTVIITIPAAASKITPAGEFPGKIVKSGDKLEIQETKIEVVPAYNTNKTFHPRADNKVGFIIAVGDKTIYHAGDTDLIPEMDNLKCDIALVPVSGKYVMTAEEAGEAVNKIRPAVAIPMHYGSVVGNLKDAERFKKLCAEKKPPIKVEILNKE
ncbi:MAG: peptidylprolyl isomerase [Elusimicrobiota bacterium]